MSFMENFSTATNITNLHMCSTDDGGGNSPTTTSHTCSHMEKPWHHYNWVGVNKEAKLGYNNITICSNFTWPLATGGHLPCLPPLCSVVLLFMLFIFTTLVIFNTWNIFNTSFFCLQNLKKNLELVILSWTLKPYFSSKVFHFFERFLGWFSLFLWQKILKDSEDIYTLLDCFIWIILFACYSYINSDIRKPWSQRLPESIIHSFIVIQQVLEFLLCIKDCDE